MAGRKDAAQGKVEAVLKGDDWHRFCMLKSLSGCRSAEYVRRAVLAGHVGEWRSFSEAVATLNVSVNGLAAALDAAQGLNERDVFQLEMRIEKMRYALAEAARHAPERGLI